MAGCFPPETIRNRLFNGYLPRISLSSFVPQPLVEDSETASAAGQYATILNTTSREALQTAIFDCLASYNSPAAIRYRQDRQQPEPLDGGDCTKANSRRVFWRCL